MEGLADPLLLSFWQRLPEAPEKVLLLDYDGTLAPFKIDKEKAIPYDGIREILDKILQTDTKLIIVTGRMVDDLLPLLGLQDIPEIWGCHGFERLLPDGSIEKQILPPESSHGLEKGFSALIELGLEKYCEKKPSSVAIHYRGLPEREKENLIRVVNQVWRPITENGDLAIHTFDGGLELRIPAVHKGAVVTRIIAESAPEAAIAYLGDDLTDEDAFRALTGRGISILVREKQRKTLADCRLVPPMDLIDFLNNWYRLACHDTRNS